MADASACFRTDVAALQRRCIDESGVGLDAPAQSSEFWPACRISDLMEIEPSRDADENAAGQRRALAHEKGLTDLHTVRSSAPVASWTVTRKAGLRP
jgi:hypothetical protein